MTNLPSSLINFRLLPPETIWLEPEQMEQAKTISECANTRPGERAISEIQQWERYLNALALLAFEQWLSERLPAPAMQRSPKPIESVSYIEVNGFTVCLLAVEHVLDETVPIPQAVIEQPALAAHFYVLHEVSEEQELVTMRGFCRYDELSHSCQRHPIQDGYYRLPLSFLDAEPNHLLVYCRSLQPAAIPLPMSMSSPAEGALTVWAQATTTLTQWLQGMFDEGWQAIDQLINSDASLSLSTRSLESGAKRGKLINLGVQLGQQTVALLVNVTPEADGKLGVIVQLHPTGEDRYLSPNLTLSLRTPPSREALWPAGKTLQAVTSRSQDNYIQLKPFKGRSGTCFSVVIQFGNNTVEENFEL